MEPKLLLIEKEASLGKIMSEYLELKGIAVTWARNSQEGLLAFYERQFNICILSLDDSVSQGLELAKKIRIIDKKLPIILISSDGSVQAGDIPLSASTVLVKPFEMQELLDLVKSLLLKSARVHRHTELKVYHFGDFRFDATRQLLIRGNASKHLTPKETGLLKMLCEHENQTLYRNVALQHIWGDDNYFNARSMDVYITKLRKYLKIDDKVKILTIHGQGFKLINAY